MRLPSPSPRRLSGRKTRSMNNRPSDVRPVMPPSTSFVSGSETTTASGRLSSMPDCRALKRRSPSPMAASTRASGASVTATRGSRRPSALMAQSLARRARCYTVALPSPLTLPRADGTLARYTMTRQTPITGAVAGAKTIPGAIMASGAGTDDLQPGPRVTIADVEAAYEESCGFIESVGGRIILMASRALAACAKGPDDYLKVYGRILGQVKEPVIIHAPDGGGRAALHPVLEPALPISRHVLCAPTRFYKTGVVFAAYLNGHQSHFRMVGGLESARSIPHLAEQFVLMDRAALLRDPEQAAERMRRVLAVAGVV